MDQKPKQTSISTASPRGADDGNSLLRGVVTRVTYRNADTGFGVLRAEAEGSLASTQSTVVGLFPQTLQAGVNFVARGRWQEHPKFGKQFKAITVTETLPTQRDAILRYLSSGGIRGLGAVLAQRVVEHFGDSALEILEQEPEKLLEVPGIGRRKLDEIISSWAEKRACREVFLFFHNYGIGPGLAQRIYSTYGDRAIETVKKNPYILSRDVWGIGFQTADRIASALGMDALAPERIRAGIMHCLKRASDDGHCFLPTDILVAKASSLLEIGEEELIREVISEALESGDCIAHDTQIYLPHLDQAEDQLARMVALSASTYRSPAKEIAPEIVTRNLNAGLVISTVQADGSMRDARVHLSEEQKRAIELASSSSMLIITGGPGCGKTTVLRTVARMFRAAGLEIRLAAPTGRAAQRLAEVCEMKASTIHRLLKFDPIARGFLHDQNDPLPIDALIVDESSMLDVQLAASLLKALKPGTRLVIVGDVDQLPSVGPGLVLADLLSLECVPRVRLTRLFRRANESRITVIAHDINSAVVPDIPEPDGNIKSDAYFLSATNPEEAATLVERLVVDQIPKRFGFRGSDIMVLTPMNQGEIGIVSLNKRIQDRIVPPHPELPTVRVGNIEFRLGDRVIQRVNNYNITENGVFNGDQGEVIGIDSDARSLFVRLWDGREVQYGSDNIEQLDLAYALTVHRSQGSEVPAVVLVLHESHSILLERQLLYTAVTRAKKLLIVVGTKKALALATKKTRSKRRYSGLPDRVSRLL